MMIGKVNQPSTANIMDVDGTLKAGVVTAGKIAVGGVSNSNQLAANTVGATAIASGVVANSHLATDVKVGSLAALLTKTKTSVQAAINDVFNSERAGELFTCTTCTWTPATKILQVSGIYIIHGTTSLKYLTLVGTVDMDFSAITDYGYAYLVGVDRSINQVAYSTSNLKVEPFGALSRNLNDPDILVLASYSNAVGRIESPFLDKMIHTKYLAGDLTNVLPIRNTIYDARGGISWDSATKILLLSNAAYLIHGKSGKYSKTNAIVTIDFSSIISYGYAYFYGITRDSNQLALSDSNVLIEEFNALTHDLTDPDVYVIATYAVDTGKLWSPFLEARVHNAYITGALGGGAAAAPWENLYPHLYPKISGAIAKLLAPAADFTVVMWGDSLFAREMYTSTTGIDATALPPMIVSKNLAYYIWKTLPMHKASYRRYDYTGPFFTEVGTWITSQVTSEWNDTGFRPNLTRLSAPGFGEAGSFAWTLAASDDMTGCTLIYRTTANGDSAATISVAEGAGYLEKWNGSAWVEANGTTLSFLESGAGQDIYQKRLKFRKAVAHQADAVTVAIARATADTDWLAYWGVELYDEKNSRYIAKLINGARGSHTFDQGTYKLADFIEYDVYEHDPDLVIVEIPLLNMIAAAGATKQIIVDSVQDTIWGDRIGHLNSDALKERSNDWADFQAIIVIPHYARSAFETDSTWAETITDTTARDIYNAVKALIISKGDVAMIDMSSAFLRHIDADALFSGDYYAGLTASGITGDSYLADSTHQNDKGTQVWARHICPLLSATST